MTESNSKLYPHDIGPTIETDFLQLTVTATSQNEANRLIRILTEKKLCASSQVQGPKSNSSEDDQEWRCRFKTSKSLIQKVSNELKVFFGETPYSIKSLPIVKGSHDFFSWLKKQLADE